MDSQQQCDTVKAVLKGKFAVIQGFLKKIEIFQKKQPNPTCTRTGGTTTKTTQSKYKYRNNQDQSRNKQYRD